MSTEVGWVCPACGAGNGPQALHCTCAGPRTACSPDDLGARWNVDPETIRRMLRRGDLPGKRLGRLLLVDVELADEWFLNLPDANRRT